ncbi:MAG: LON peptidase substrate-binding domain-containing protein [Chthoniobacter sp.]|nr:LON peptidase substrate-binding domain-containing protein [Chthoniobacter sp.]
MKSIGQQRLNLPAHAPIMVLPEAHLFPNSLLPLYIFEPRYREMLSWSLQQDRMFCIAPMKPGISEARTVDDFHHIVGLGLVRACVGCEDGTSNLILQGLARMRIVGFLQDAPFRIAELRELASTPASPEDSEQLTARLLEVAENFLVGEAKLPAQLERQLEQIDDPSVLADVIAHACVRDAEERQAIFEELDVSKRVKRLLQYLRA